MSRHGMSAPSTSCSHPSPSQPAHVHSTRGGGTSLLILIWPCTGQRGGTFA